MVSTTFDALGCDESHAQLPPEAARAFLTEAVESIKAIPDAQQRQDVTGKWAVAFGEALHAEAGTRAKSGQWNKAQQANTQLDTLIAQAPDSAAYCPTGQASQLASPPALPSTHTFWLTAHSARLASQAEGVVKLLHSDQTAIHLVTLLEALPIQETIEAIEELESLGLPIGSVIVNRNIPPFLPPEDLAKAAEGDIDADAVRTGLSRAGIALSDADFAGLLTETIEHASRIRARAESAEQLDQLHVARLDLPTIPDGVDLGSLYELAETLAQQGVR